MGVLEPLERNSEEAQRLKGDWFNRLENTPSELQNYHSQIINNELDKLAEHAPAFYDMYPDEELKDMETKEEILEEARYIKKLRDEVSLDAIKAQYAQKFVQENDVKIDYEKPIETYKSLDSLQKDIENLDQRIQNAIVDRLDINEEIFNKGYDRNDYENRESFYGTSDSVKAFFLQEALIEINENINKEKENLLSKAVDEHREHSQEYADENDLDPFPENSVNWEDEIDEDSLANFLDLSELAEGTAGLTLHKMMEEVCSDIDSLEPEYRLDFLNKGGRFDTPIYNVDGNKIRIDNTVVPDAVDDLIVYEFKHMPSEQRKNLEKHGKLNNDDERFMENVNQVNKYLNKLDLPAGMLVYISSDIEIEEFVVEKHNGQITQESLDTKFHRREEYNFNNLTSKLENNL